MCLFERSTILAGCRGKGRGPNRQKGLTWLKIEEAHAENRCEKSAGKKSCSEERERLHGPSVSCACVGQTSLLPGNLEVQLCVFLGYLGRDELHLRGYQWRVLAECARLLVSGRVTALR